LQSGLPVLAIINHGNDLQTIIETYKVGRATTDRSQENLQLLVNSLLEEVSLPDSEINSRCKTLAVKLFSSQAAVEQIVQSLNSVK
jgi:hypothetical protein